MNRSLLLVGSALALAGPAAPAFADAVNGAAASGTAAVIITNPITVTQTQTLDFGTITSGALGTVSIYPVANTRGVTGGVGAVAADVGQPGAFLITGQDNASINIVVGPAITGFAGGITGVTIHSDLRPHLVGGVFSFTVGGTLTIPAQTQPGQYTGTYTVVVNYP